MGPYRLVGGGVVGGGRLTSAGGGLPTPGESLENGDHPGTGRDQRPGVQARPEQEDQPGMHPVRVVAQPQRVPPGHCLLAESEEAIRIPVVRRAACACKTNVLRLIRG